MKTVNVSCSRDYSILIERGMIKRVGEIISEVFPNRRVCIVSDKTVSDLYLDKVISSFSKRPESYIFDPGEEHKTLETVEGILTFLAEKSFTRSDVLVALGGGITGDITGFAAAVYLRGIEFVQIPTTVLSAVDSSVGGKTGVNLCGIKNQVGAFWQPSLVISDPDVFETLPHSEYSSGMSEVVKYAAICDEGLADKLEKGADIEDIIEICVTIKRDIVSSDERDTGRRQLLNLGHTFGHAVEKVSENKYSHGQAVAVGMVMAFKAAQKLGMCSNEDTERLVSLLNRYSLPTECDLDRQLLLSAMANDKKRAGGVINLILPERFGKCVLYKTEVEKLEKVFFDL